MASSNPAQKPPPQQRTCLCSPTTHPGSFRCQLHRSSAAGRRRSKYLEVEVMAKVNSLKAFLLQMIKPSSHDLQRRRKFQPKPSRFSLLNNNNNNNASNSAHHHHHHHNHHLRNGVAVI